MKLVIYKPNDSSWITNFNGFMCKTVEQVLKHTYITSEQSFFAYTCVFCKCRVLYTCRILCCGGIIDHANHTTSQWVWQYVPPIKIKFRPSKVASDDFCGGRRLVHVHVQCTLYMKLLMLLLTKRNVNCCLDGKYSVLNFGNFVEGQVTPPHLYEP